MHDVPYMLPEQVLFPCESRIQILKIFDPVELTTYKTSVYIPSFSIFESDEFNPERLN
jgi:hypothetical protein